MKPILECNEKIEDLENPEKILKITESESASSRNVREVVNLNHSVINIENSNDVVIKPSTHFNGPVTIYQNSNELSDKPCNKKNVSDKSGPTFKLTKINQTPNSKKLRYYKRMIIIGVVAVLILIIGITIGGAFIANPSLANSNVEDVDEDDCFINRDEWGGKEPLNFSKTLSHPVDLVVISHTATPFCTTKLDCASRVRSIQNYHVGTLGASDIGYNFLIGGDGRVYVGRGWNFQNIIKTNSIAISFIGNYIYDRMTKKQEDITLFLLKQGVSQTKLTIDFAIVSHNQTTSTQSPGVNVYKIISKWQHFTPNMFN